MKKELNKYLKSLEEKELRKEIVKLVEKFPAVKDYYSMELNTKAADVLEKYKGKLKAEYFPKRGFGKARSGESSKIVRDFAKIAAFKGDVIELWLYRTELMIHFTGEYGEINEGYYNSLTRGFKSACELMTKEKLKLQYAAKAWELLEKASSFGWGVPDEMQFYLNDNDIPRV